jgi:hypothetical protein
VQRLPGKAAAEYRGLCLHEIWAPSRRMRKQKH